MGELLELISSGESLAAEIGEMLRVTGLAAIVIVLLVGFVFFLPTIVASLRHIKLRVLVCVLNILAIASIFVAIYIPIVIWLVIMLIAISNRPEQKNRNVIPSINIFTNKEEK